MNLAWHGEIKHEHHGLYDLLNATRQIHGDSMMSYLIYMAIRVMEMKRILKSTGSIYLHCDDNANAYLKLMMDAIFGRRMFRNDIIWKRTSGKGLNPRRYVRNCDRILLYGNGKKPTWNQQYYEFDPLYGQDWRTDARGPWEPENLTGGKAGGPEAYASFRGVLPAAGRAWAPPPRGKFPLDVDLPSNYETMNALEKCEALEAAGLIYWPDKQGGKPRYKKYLSTLQGRYASDIITDIPPVGARADERQHFPTQKPLALIHRFIAASSNEGDMIFDPFCGCATACIVAQELKRQWVGIDISPKAADLVVDRMKLELRLFFAGIHRTDVPERTDLGKIISYNDAKNKRALYGEQGGYCHGCEHHFSPRNLTVDHIIPRSKGGTDHISNLQLLCGACNSLKGDRPQEYLLVCLTDKGWIKRKKAA